MIRYKPLKNDNIRTTSKQSSNILLGSTGISADIGPNPATVLRSRDGKMGAVMYVGETGADFGKSSQEALDKCLRKLNTGGYEKESLEGAVVGGSDSAKWKIRKLIQIIKAESIVPQEYDLNGDYYRKIHFEPQGGILSVFREEINPDHYNPATASLSLEDGARGFKEGQASGVVANATRFFRQETTFTALRELIVPEHLRLAPNETLSVWCAACSNGVEAYSYAMYIHRLLTRVKADLSFKVLGTDINQQLIETAKQGEYEISKDDLRNYRAYFERYGELHGNQLRFGNEIRRHLSFRTFDIRSRPKKRKFHVIICANVFQYYHDDAREYFLKNFAAVSMRPGYIFVGPVNPKIIHRLGLSKLPQYKMLRAE